MMTLRVTLSIMKYRKTTLSIAGLCITTPSIMTMAIIIYILSTNRILLNVPGANVKKLFLSVIYEISY